MQPTFPPDHHSRRPRSSGGLRDRQGRVWRATELAHAAELGAACLSRQCLQANDPTDPRGGI
jgi:hypothetical protein